MPVSKAEALSDRRTGNSTPLVSLKANEHSSKLLTLAQASSC